MPGADENQNPPNPGGSGDNGNESAEKLREMPKAARDEAASLRVRMRDEFVPKTELEKWRELGKTPDEIRQQIEGNGNNAKTLEGQVKSLHERLEQEMAKRERAEELARSRAKSARLAELAAEANLTDRPSAIELLERRADVDEKGNVVFVVQDESGIETKIPATREALAKHKLLPPIYYPAEGGSGSGSNGGTGSAGSNLDPSRLSDPKYVKENREAVKNLVENG